MSAASTRFPAEEVEQSIPAALLRRTAAVAERVALRHGGVELRYGELHAASARLAATLGALLGQRPPGRVALLLDDPSAQIVALLGVLQAGHAFVPLDGSQPPGRLALCLEDMDPCLVLCEPATLALARQLAGRVPVLDLSAREPAAADTAREPAVHEPAAHEPPTWGAGAGDVAFIQYTSGSAGRPKGVIQLHRNLLHAVRSYTRDFDVKPDDRFAILGHYAFGATLAQLFRALLNGATVLPYDVRRQGLLGLAGWLAAEEVSIYASVPSLFRHWTAELSGRERFPRLRVLTLGGESAHARDVARFRELFPPSCRFVNSLGMTEQPSFRRLILAHDAPVADGLLPVGPAVEGTEVLLWDERGQPVAAGAVGEIVLRSRYLSPGYWRQPALTEQAFVADPSGNGRLFRTGDLGRLAADGCLEHLGRKDGRLKIRGHRVEAADVEAALMELGGLREVAVVARSGAAEEAELVAVVVPERGSRVNGSALREALATVLPAYMLPVRFVVRDALPLLANGKLDRKQLAEGATEPAAATASADDVAAPADDGTLPQDDAAPDPLEQRVLAIWEQVLERRGLGRHQDFFDLGGHSLHAARIVARIERQLGVSLPLATLYQARTIERLARAIRRDEGVASPLVLLQAGGPGPPLFCVPGAGTDAAVFSQLARQLGDAQPFYALEWPGLCGVQQPDRVEALAACFLEHLRREQPEGPYRLGGFSFGGLVALEMAQQLRAQGQEVELLALFDTSRPDLPRPQPPPDPRGRIRTARRRFRRWLLPTGAKYQAYYWSRRTIVAGLREKLERLRFRVDRVLRPRRAAPPPSWRFTFVRELCLLASRRYVPRPYAGPLTVFRNEGQPGDDPGRAAPDLGWAPLAQGELLLRRVPGSHGEELQPPHVATLARELRALLGAREPESEPVATEARATAAI